MIATRGSSLALAQAQIVLLEFRRLAPWLDLRLEVIDSDGDLNPEAAVPDLGGQGWFSSRLERALAEGRVDAAVHSAKDLPSELSAGLRVGAYLKREDPRDALVTEGGLPWRALPAGARVGTSSPRRAAQLQALRPDLEVVPMRGNLDTRLRRVAAGDIDAVLVAMAGLIRIGRPAEGQILDPQLECTPAPAQGAIALEIRVGGDLADLAASLDDATTRVCVEAERAVLAGMGGGCRLPLGALAEAVGDGDFALTVAWAPPDRPRDLLRRSGRSGAGGLRPLAERLATELRG
ncbi:MAG: hydroxymethylbilane synthase [Candidatus Dormibacteria bacterium]